MIPVGILTAAATSSFSFLLDDYPGATAAYSLRKLRSAYTGNCIQVRRSSDNLTQNIGFLNNVINTTALLTFVGAGNGYVSIWYDQSGNSYDAIEGTSNLQPIVVNSGNLLLFNSKPSLFFSSSNLGVFDYYFNLSQPNTYFIVTQGTLTNSIGYRTIMDSYYPTATNRNGIGKTDTNFYYLYAGSLVTSSVSYSTNKFLFSAIFNTTNSYLYQNNVVIINNQNAGNQSMSGIKLGSFNSTTNLYEGYLPEYVYYHSNQTANRIGIQNNINTFYTIY